MREWWSEGVVGGEIRTKNTIRITIICLCVARRQVWTGFWIVGETRCWACLGGGGPLDKGVDPSPRSVLQARFRLEAFRYPQEEIIQAIMEDKDALVIMPTGGGKSLCYQLPALLRPGVTLVVSPLIALMKDQVDGLKAKGIAAAMINSSQSWPQQRQTLRALRENKLKLLYIAPERFRAGSFTDSLEGVPISLFAVDEAHCISQWGHDFRPDYLRLGNAMKSLGNPLCAAFTATATPEVREDIRKHLHLESPEVFVSGFARPNPDLYPTQTQNQTA